MTAPISDDVRAIEEACGGEPNRGQYPCSISGTLDYARDLRAWSESVHAAANPARLRRVLDTLQAMGEALTLAEDVLARFPFSTEIWPNGTHPNAGITQIRDALALYEGTK